MSSTAVGAWQRSETRRAVAGSPQGKLESSSAKRIVASHAATLRWNASPALAAEPPTLEECDLEELCGDVIDTGLPFTSGDRQSLDWKSTIAGTTPLA
jgi:hypothetical protein